MPGSRHPGSRGRSEGLRFSPGGVGGVTRAASALAAAGLITISTAERSWAVPMTTLAFSSFSRGSHFWAAEIEVSNREGQAGRLPAPDHAADGFEALGVHVELFRPRAPIGVRHRRRRQLRPHVTRSERLRTDQGRKLSRRRSAPPPSYTQLPDPPRRIARRVSRAFARANASGACRLRALAIFADISASV